MELCPDAGLWGRWSDRGGSPAAAATHRSATSGPGSGVTFRTPLPTNCHGTVMGTVRCVPNTGPMGYGMGATDPTVRGLLVGRFSYRLP
jgi:hypothetical protein